MKMKTIICSALAVGLFVVGCASEHHEAEAKVSKADAQSIALGRVPNGTIKEGELEKEKGKLIWSFDISTPDSKDITEVNVDAMNGQVVSVQKENAEQEEKESKKEKD